MSSYLDHKKDENGRSYTGAPIGLTHRWAYEGAWTERKTSRSTWDVAFKATKRRRTNAPPASGAGTGSGFSWLLVARQHVRKLDENAYATFLTGVKHQIQFRSPESGAWVPDFAGGETPRVRASQVLTRCLTELATDERAVGALVGEHPDDPWHMNGA